MQGLHKIRRLYPEGPFLTFTVFLNEHRFCIVHKKLPATVQTIQEQSLTTMLLSIFPRVMGYCDISDMMPCTSFTTQGHSIIWICRNLHFELS